MQGNALSGSETALTGVSGALPPAVCNLSALKTASAHACHDERRRTLSVTAATQLDASSAGDLGWPFGRWIERYGTQWMSHARAAGIGVRIRQM